METKTDFDERDVGIAMIESKEFILECGEFVSATHSNALTMNLQPIFRPSHAFPGLFTDGVIINMNLASWRAIIRYNGPTIDQSLPNLAKVCSKLTSMPAPKE